LPAARKHRVFGRSLVQKTPGLLPAEQNNDNLLLIIIFQPATTTKKAKNMILFFSRPTKFNS
jgi:hypothetical protein